MKRTIRLGWLGWALLSAPLACDRGHESTTESSRAAPSAAPSLDGPASSTTRTESPEAGGDAIAGAAGVWVGAYKSAASSLYVPQDWKVRWRPVDTADGIGDGSMTLSVDASNGQVRGNLEGPLGPAVVDGYVSEGNVSATIVRREPRDHGFAGVLSGKTTAEHLEGTMNLSEATGGALRTATFVLSRSEGAKK